jgi:hypothetical protein
MAHKMRFTGRKGCTRSWYGPMPTPKPTDWCYPCRNIQTRCRPNRTYCRSSCRANTPPTPPARRRRRRTRRRDPPARAAAGTAAVPGRAEVEVLRPILRTRHRLQVRAPAIARPVASGHVHATRLERAARVRIEPPRSAHGRRPRCLRQAPAASQREPLGQVHRYGHRPTHTHRHPCRGSRVAPGGPRTGRRCARRLGRLIIRVRVRGDLLPVGSGFP